MKFKEIPPYKNKILMLIIIPILIFAVVCFFIMEKYIFSIIYLIVTAIILYFFFCTEYFLTDDYILIKVKPFKFKINFQDIVSVDEYIEKIKISTKKFKYVICPDKKELFIEKLKKNLNKDAVYTVLEGEK